MLHALADLRQEAPGDRLRAGPLCWRKPLHAVLGPLGDKR